VRGSGTVIGWMCRPQFRDRGLNNSAEGFARFASSVCSPAYDRNRFARG
jgi:hypothetical protein